MALNDGDCVKKLILVLLFIMSVNCFADNRVFNHPALKGYPQSEILRLILPTNGNDCSIFLTKEEEQPGYLAALVGSYIFMVNSISETEPDLSLQRMMELHRRAFQNVDATRMDYGRRYGIFGGELRRENLRVPLTLTPAVEKWGDWKEAFQSLTRVNKSLYKLNERYYMGHNFTTGLDDYVNGNHIETDAETEQVEKEANRLIAIYNAEIKSALTSREKLLAITKIIVDFNVLHPFGDGNGRVFVGLVLNELLLRNGFTPVILDDFRIFRGHTLNEIISKLEIGLQSFNDVVQNPKYYQIGTKNMLYEVMKKSKNQYLINRIKGVDAYRELLELGGGIN